MGGLCGRFVKMVAEFLADLAEVWFASRFFRESRVQRLGHAGTCWDMLELVKSRMVSPCFAMFRQMLLILAGQCPRFPGLCGETGVDC